MRAGDVAAQQQKWDEAFSYYQQASDLDSSSFEILNKYADAARLVKDYALALTLYERSYAKDNGKLNPNSLYYLAWMQKFNGQYEDAQRNFKKFIKKHKAKADEAIAQLADQQLKSAIWALNYKRPLELKEVELLPPAINTTESEVAPFADDKFYYASTAMGDNASWNIYSIAPNETPIKIDIAGLPAGAEISNLCVLDNQCYFALAENETVKIYTAQRSENGFVNAKEIETLNTDGNINTMPYAYRKGNFTYIYFASNRPEGEGGMDLWIAQSENESYTKPINLGNRLNTPGDELTPHFYDGHLYFSSDWHLGFGGLDIFKSKEENGNYNKVENAGPPYNSSANDFYFTMDERNEVAYFASNREGSNAATSNATCCNDIYQVPLNNPEPTSNPESENRIKLMDLMATIPVILYFHNDEPNPDVWDTTTTLTYMMAYHSYIAQLPTYLKENTKGVSAEMKEDAEQITHDFFELTVNKGVADLKLFSELLLEELDEGNSLKILVRGFASPRAKSDYNLNLTKRRTSSLVNFLSADSEGAFLKYINDTASNGARLEFELIPFGEVKAKKSVSDDIVDEKNSIYVRSACLERKIEIENVIQIPNTVRFVKPILDADTFDFGRINHREPVRHIFFLRNEGNCTMQVDSIITTCGCTLPKITKNSIPAGEQVELEIGFNPFGKKPGSDTQTATIYIKGEEPLVVVIKADVFKATP